MCSAIVALLAFLCVAQASVKLNDRLLCEVCHALANHTFHTLYKVEIMNTTQCLTPTGASLSPGS